MYSVYPRIGACAKCKRADVYLRPDGDLYPGRLTLHDDSNGKACNFGETTEYPIDELREDADPMLDQCAKFQEQAKVARMLDADKDLYDLERMLRFAWFGIMSWEKQDAPEKPLSEMRLRIEAFHNRLPNSLDLSNLVVGCEAWLRMHDKWKSLCAADPK